jgi:hypothetical protein
MKSKMRKLSAYVLALAVALMAGMSVAEAGPYAAKKLLVDLQAESGDFTDSAGKTNDGVVSMAPPASGATVTVQLYLEDGLAGSNAFNCNFEFADDANFTGNFQVTAAGGILSGTGYLDPNSLFGYSPGARQYAVAGTANAADVTIPANNYIGSITLSVLQDIPEGTTLTFSSAILTARGDVADTLDVTSATLTFQTPAGPALSASPALAEIPRGGSASSTVTLANVTSGDAINWTVTSTGPTATVTGQTGLTFSTTASGASEMITVNASGAAGTVTVAASVGGTAVTPVDIVFSEQVPAELAAFGGEIRETGVAVNWTTTSQTNNAGWRVMRSTDGVNYAPVSEMIPGAGTSDAVLPYSFFDNSPPQSEQVFYRLDQVDLDGTIHSSNAIEVILGTRFLDLPTEFSTSVYPNPFNPATTISYDLPSESAVAIVIYDALGQEIRRLVTEQKAAGRYTVQWDSRDNLGRSVGSGVYIAKVEAGAFSASQKMLLLK